MRPVTAGGRSSSSPRNIPPRNASPAPVGSMTCRAGAGGTWVVCAVQDEVGALFAVGDDDELFLGGDVGHGQAGFALDHGEFVVVAHNAPRGIDALAEIVR